MVVCAAGNVDHDALVDIANDRFHDLQGRPAPRRRTRPTTSAASSASLSDHEQAHIVLGLEGRAYNSDGFYAAQILASILGGGMSSRLFQEVREKRGLVYSIYAFHWAFADSGIFGVAASTGEAEVSELMPVVLDELRKATENITDEEVIRVRNQIRAGLLMSLESPSLACRPARPPADPLGPPHPPPGDGRPHQSHHGRPRGKMIAGQLFLHR